MAAEELVGAAVQDDRSRSLQRDRTGRAGPSRIVDLDAAAVVAVDGYRERSAAGCVAGGDGAALRGIERVRAAVDRERAWAVKRNRRTGALRPRAVGVRQCSCPDRKRAGNGDGPSAAAFARWGGIYRPTAPCPAVRNHRAREVDLGAGAFRKSAESAEARDSKSIPQSDRGRSVAAVTTPPAVA